MEKLYNNLSIENLVKTDWLFSHFNYRQRQEIKTGLKENIDVSKYANPKYDWEQMREIRWGLEANLDVSIYAKPEISDEQMEQIREKLLKKSTLSQCTLFCYQKIYFLKIFWIAQNRFEFFDVDISTFVVPKKTSNLAKNASHVQQSRLNVKIAQNRFI